MSETPTTVTPIITPVKALLSSRAFLLALATFIVDTLIIAVPSLEPLRGDFMSTLTALVGLLIAKIGAEDMVKAHAAGKVAAAQHAANAVIMAAKVSSPPPAISTPER